MNFTPVQNSVLKASTHRGSIVPSDSAALILFKDGPAVFAGFEFRHPDAPGCVIHDLGSRSEFETWCAGNELRLTGISIDTRMFVVEPRTDDAAFAFRFRRG
jgi:hypothetical protein